MHGFCSIGGLTASVSRSSKRSPNNAVLQRKRERERENSRATVVLVD